MSRYIPQHAIDPQHDQSEIWLPVIGFEDLYEVNEIGTVVRIRIRSGIIYRTPLKPFSSKKGYKHVTLSKNNRHVYRTVHSIVAEAFHGSRPTGMQINHIDFITTNNHPSNLEYVTAKENIQKSIVAGRR